ncbi:glyoxalase [Hujiaoplasma nucleasis]|uniref:Glyoxalase n=1 Tax=Hujiaoplasma nucleasis TaxID=2725268 RepID=A0A7L6N4N8_9MOLU|nr:VOC family protein [Hujiaoplasma nucleasis]QLY40208.1 glyoxalase [Hujiaoplasma nucleasis]
MLYYYHKDAIHISKIDLLVKDLKISKDFYTNSIGFSVLKENENYISLTVDHETEIIRLHLNEDESYNNQKNNIYHFAILLPSRKDLGKFLHHLISKQIPIDGAADHLVSEAIYLQDPDGIGIEIYSDKDDSQWNYSNQQIEMETLPFDYKGVYYATDEDDIFRSLPIDTIIGHLHLQVDKLKETKEFYNEIIGFNIVNDKINNAVFMSDKNYHHHLAINSWSPQRSRVQRMKSFTITYPNCEKFIETFENLKKANIEFEETNDGILLKDPENTKIYLSIK